MPIPTDAIPIGDSQALHNLADPTTSTGIPMKRAGSNEVDILDPNVVTAIPGTIIFIPPEGDPQFLTPAELLALMPVIVQLEIFPPTSDVVTGDGAAFFDVPSELAGMNLTGVAALVITAGTTGTTDVQIARVRAGTPADMLSTKLTIDSTETHSSTAATAAVVNAATDDVATGDLIRIDIDATATTKAKGLIVTLRFAK